MKTVKVESLPVVRVGDRWQYRNHGKLLIAFEVLCVTKDMGAWCVEERGEDSEWFVADVDFPDRHFEKLLSRKPYHLQPACANCKKCFIRHVQDDPTQFFCTADGKPVPPDPCDETDFPDATCLKGKKLQQRIVAIGKRAAWDKSHQVKPHGICGLYEPGEEDEGE